MDYLEFEIPNLANNIAFELLYKYFTGSTNVIQPQSPSEHLLFATVLIQGTKKTTGESITGTGFFFSFSGKDGQIPAIITNKHVVDGCAGIHVLLHHAESLDGKSPSNISSSLIIQNIEGLVVYHPSSETDLCAIPVGPIIHQAREANMPIFYSTLDESLLPTQENLESLFALESVVMVGYPIGLSDNHNNFPILRRGSTASHPAIDFNGMSKGCVDIACFPGSSGSPILVLDEGLFVSKSGVITGSNRIILLGILSCGPLMSVTGKIEITPIPTGNALISKHSQMINLGYYEKARELITLKKALFDVLKLQYS